MTTPGSAPACRRRGMHYGSERMGNTILTDPSSEKEILGQSGTR